MDTASWLDAWLADYRWENGPEEAGAALVQTVLALPEGERVALLRESVARLPELREMAGDPFAWHKGNALYELACSLYSAKLTHSEADVCALLVASKHACGHGADVKPPFELALRWARTNGVSSAWLAAVRTFIAGLAGLTSAQANHLKTRGGLLLLLDDEAAVTARCYSGRFRTELARLPEVERAAWARLVLWMGTAMGTRMPKGYDLEVGVLVARLGADGVLGRLEDWMPTSDGQRPCRLETAGSHLFKNFVWLLLVMSGDPGVAARCDALVERLLQVDIAPEQRGRKIAHACAVYFSGRPREVARRPLEALLARTSVMQRRDWDTESIRKLAEAALG